jgi:hypothetical protein
VHIKVETRGYRNEKCATLRRKKTLKLKTILQLFILSLVATSVFSAEPQCSAEHSGYCYYQGKVDRIYVNSGNLILMYFDTPMQTSQALIAGMSITNGGAAAFKITENEIFANYFYSTALAAQASGRDIVIQMRGVESGYPRFDRVWLAQ